MTYVRHDLSSRDQLTKYFFIKGAPDTDLAGNPANLDAGYPAEFTDQNLNVF
jgi:hypothetical protein